MAAIGFALVLPAFARLTPAGTLAARPVLPAAVLLRGMLTFAFFCADAYVPLALVAVRGTDLATAGIALTAATIAWTAGAWTQERGVARFGARWFVGVGFAIVGLGITGTLLALVPAVPLFVGVVAWGVAGLGMGLSYAPLTLVVLRESEAGGQGRASASLQLSDVLGTALGSGVGGALIALSAGPGALRVTGGAGAGVAAGATAIATGLAAAFTTGVVVAALGCLLSGRLNARS